MHNRSRLENFVYVSLFSKPFHLKILLSSKKAVVWWDAKISYFLFYPKIHNSPQKNSKKKLIFFYNSSKICRCDKNHKNWKLYKHFKFYECKKDTLTFVLLASIFGVLLPDDDLCCKKGEKYLKNL